MAVVDRRPFALRRCKSDSRRFRTLAQRVQFSDRMYATPCRKTVRQSPLFVQFSRMFRNDAMSRSIVTMIARGVSRRAAARFGSRVVRMRNTGPIVSITFDDCPRTAVTTGAAILEANGVRGTFYLSGNLAGRMWENGSQFVPADVLRLLSAGHEVGCHTFHHPDCATLPAAAIDLELTANKAFLAAAAPGFMPRSFAYPYGSVGYTAKRIIGRQFVTCRGVQSGVNELTIDPAELRATEIPHDASNAAWLTPWLDRVRASNGWLVLYTHDVADDPTAFGCTPAGLAETIAAIKAAGIAIRTVEQAAEAVLGATMEAGARTVVPVSSSA